MLLNVSNSFLYYDTGIVPIAERHHPYFLVLGDERERRRLESITGLTAPVGGGTEGSQQDGQRPFSPAAGGYPTDPLGHITGIGEVESYLSFSRPGLRQKVFRVHISESRFVPQVSDTLFLSHGFYTAEHDIPYVQRAAADLAARDEWILDSGGSKRQLKVLCYDIETPSFERMEGRSPAEIIGYTTFDIALSSSHDLDTESFHFELHDIGGSWRDDEIIQLNARGGGQDEVTSILEFVKMARGCHIISGHNVLTFDNLHLHNRIRSFVDGSEGVLTVDERDLLRTFLHQYTHNENFFTFGKRSAGVTYHPVTLDTYHAALNFYRFLDSYDLKSLALFFDIRIEGREYVNRNEMAGIPWDRLLRYNMNDVQEQAGLTRIMLQQTLPLAFVTGMPVETLLSSGATKVWDYMTMIRGARHRKIIPPTCRAQGISASILKLLRGAGIYDPNRVDVKETLVRIVRGPETGGTLHETDSGMAPDTHDYRERNMGEHEGNTERSGEYIEEDDGEVDTDENAEQGPEGNGEQDPKGDGEVGSEEGRVQELAGGLEQDPEGDGEQDSEGGGEQDLETGKDWNRNGVGKGNGNGYQNDDHTRNDRITRPDQDLMRVIKYGPEMPDWVKYPYLAFNTRRMEGLEGDLGYHLPGGMTIQPADVGSDFIPWWHMIVADVGAMYPTILKGMNIGADTVSLALKGEPPDHWVWLKQVSEDLLARNDIQVRSVDEMHSEPYARRGHFIGVRLNPENGLVNLAMTGILDLIFRIKRELKERGARGDDTRSLKMMYDSLKGMRNAGTHGILVASNVSCRQFNLWGGAAITTTGQRILQDAMEEFEGRNMRVVYGDTDGIYVACARSSKGLPGVCMAFGTAPGKGDYLTDPHEVIRVINLLNDRWRERLSYPGFELEPESADCMLFVKHKNYLIWKARNGTLSMSTKGNNFKGSDKAPLARKVLGEIMFRVLREHQEWSSETRVKDSIRKSIQKHTLDIVSGLDLSRVDIRDLTLVQTVRPPDAYKERGGEKSALAIRARALGNLLGHDIRSSSKFRFLVLKIPLPGISDPSKSGIRPMDFMWPRELVTDELNIDLDWYREMIINYVKGAFGLREIALTTQIGLDSFM